MSLVLLPQQLGQANPSAADASASSPNTPAPTVRYARGENIGLADIVTEWRGYYPDIPIYQCVCQTDICDQRAGWPYREYDRYQLSVALGPSNGKAAESAGFNCFDIADGSRPSNPRSFSAAERNPDEPVAAAPPPVSQASGPNSPEPSVAPSATPPPSPVADTVRAPVTPPIPADSGTADSGSIDSAPPTPVAATASPTASSGIPQATVVDNGAAIRLDWPSGTSDVVTVANSNWNLNVLDALDCESIRLVDEKVLEAQRVVGLPAVDSTTGNVAVPVLLDSCVETDQSAVFVLDPNEGGGYALYRSQLPGDRTFPNEFSTYAFSSITGVQYWDGYLLVRQTNAAGAEVISIFLPGNTPAGEYGGCGVVRAGEGANTLCEN
ncbi:MAG: hypothetical protein AAF703_04465 [Cyanobacteria bacterium P01_D01_bin.105]